MPRPDHVTCPTCGFEVEAPSGEANFCPSCGADLRGGAPRERTATRALLGAVVADRYRLLSLLGEGGMGAVYKAEHIRMGKVLALKLLRGAFARDEGAVARFRAEAQIVSRLSHPHTIAVFDFGELADGDGFYLAMEYVQGSDLAAVLHEQGTLPEARAVSLGAQILGSLAEAHDAGVVHRDVKPANVMVQRARTGEDFVKVLDFGIAKLRDDPANAATTSAGAIIGTPSYLSPEQARGEEIDGRADLYSVGALLYELLSGRPPFHGMSPVAMVSAHLRDPPRPLRELAPQVSEGLAAVVHRALEKRPAARYASADEMRAALLGVAVPALQARPATPRPPTGMGEVTGGFSLASRRDFEAFEREVVKLKRSRAAGPAVALVLLLAVVLGAWRWPDLYGALHAAAPGLARALPEALRPAGLFDGVEHEPNNVPGQASPLPLPPGPDGAPGGGVAQVRGHVGAKVSDTSGDIDVYRVVVPAGAPWPVLEAAFEGERPGDGIRGLDVSLSLNRQRDDGSERTSAPLVAAVDEGGAGAPERLRAPVEPGTYFLAVREKHLETTGPVEKPTDWYLLSVRLRPAAPGEPAAPPPAPAAPP